MLNKKNTIGQDVLEYCADNLNSIVVTNEHDLSLLEIVNKVVFVGSSGTGKSTLIDSIRSNGLCNMPKRYVSRDERANDNLQENIFVSKEKFQSLVGNDIGVSWTRVMEEGRQEKYGFHSSCLNSQEIQIFSGNNALFQNKESIYPKDFFNIDTIWIGVYAPSDVIKKRLTDRSPDLLTYKPKEFSYRLSDSSDSPTPYVHLLVNNHGKFENTSKGDINMLINKILSI